MDEFAILYTVLPAWICLRWSGRLLIAALPAEERMHVEEGAVILTIFIKGGASTKWYGLAGSEVVK